jgi:hypothetical protein
MPPSASLVEQALGSPSFFRRRQIEISKEIAGLEMRALLLELSTALHIDQGRRHIRKISFGIVFGGMTLRLDKDSPTRTEPTQRLFNLPATPTSSAGTAESRSGPRNFAVR